MRCYLGICVALMLASPCLAAPPVARPASRPADKGPSLADKFDTGLSQVRSKLTDLIVPKSDEAPPTRAPNKPRPHQHARKPAKKSADVPEEHPLPSVDGDQAHKPAGDAAAPDAATDVATTPPALPSPPDSDAELGEAVAADAQSDQILSEMKLHERLSLFRQSAFGDSPAETSAAPSVESAADAAETDVPVAATPRTPLEEPRPAVAQAAPTQPGDAPDVPAKEPLHSHAASPPTHSAVTGEPTLAPPKPKTHVAMADRSADAAATATELPQVVPPPPAAASTPAATIESTPVAAVPIAPAPIVAATPAMPVAVPTSPPAPASDHAGGGTLAPSQTPVLQVETIGPRQIRVGVPARYELALSNSGTVAAEGVTITAELPPSAEVVSSKPTAGAAEAAATTGKKSIVWTLERLDAGQRQSLVLELVPREAKAFELAVRAEHKPVATQASIEVQEPKLVLALEGPREVLYGDQKTYRLQITNAGTGVAENIRLLLQPIDAGETPPAEHQIAALAPGQSESAEVELVTQFAGILTLRVDAACDGGIESHLTERIVVRRAKLEVSVEGAELKFVGNDALYNIRVKNSGDAAASNLTLEATLPAGSRYVSDSRQGRLSSTRDRVTWDLGTLDKGADVFLSIKCVLDQAGQSAMQVSAKADLGVVATDEQPIVVDTKADLALEVTDPEGNVPVGLDTPYAITLRNRGARDAEKVDVVVYFSHGIEPLKAEGPAHRIAPGQIIFEQIEKVPAGSETKLVVHAMPERPGSHLIRVEAVYQPLDCRVVKEETTYFYKGPISQGTQSGLSGPSAVSAPQTAARPATKSSTPANR